MSWTEEREFPVGATLKVTAEVLVGDNEELVMPGGKEVPEGRQEMVIGVQKVYYNAAVGGGREPEWETLDHDIGSILTELETLKARNDKLEKENIVYERRFKAFGLGVQDEAPEVKDAKTA